MDDLLKKKCVSCEGGAIPFDISEIHQYQKKVDGWDISEEGNKIFFLKKKFTFRNFLESQKFINSIYINDYTKGLKSIIDEMSPYKINYSQKMTLSYLDPLVFQIMFQLRN